MELMGLGRYIIEVSILECKANIKLNEVTLIKHDKDFSNKILWFANQWVKKGKNKIEADIDFGPMGPNPQAKVIVALNYYEADPQAIIGETEYKTIAKIEWPKHHNEGHHLPVNVSATGYIEEQIPLWKWLSSDSMSLDKKTTESATNLASELIKAINSKNEKKLDELLYIQNFETDKAYSLPEGHTQKDDVFKKAWDVKTWSILKVSKNEMKFILHGENRLLEVTDKNGNPLIKTNPKSKEYKLQMRVFVSNFGGKFYIAR